MEMAKRLLWDVGDVGEVARPPDVGEVAPPREFQHPARVQDVRAPQDPPPPSCPAHTIPIPSIPPARNVRHIGGGVVVVEIGRAHV